ncbi:MAG: CopG family transcriptional regulator [Planctomycetes bacterium]|nr:CopG family transcriptional regulator [Planctomycetota bacterium]
MSKQVQADIPDLLFQEAQEYVNQGGASDLSDLIVEALRRFLDTHAPEIEEQFIREDVEWGLNGRG